MKCKDFEERLVEMLSGESGDQKKEPLDRHLSECERCSKTHRFLGELLNKKLSQEPPEEYWKSFTPRLMRKIREREEVPFLLAWFFSHWKALATVAACLFIVSLLPLFFVSTPPPAERDIDGILQEMTRDFSELSGSEESYLPMEQGMSLLVSDLREESWLDVLLDD